jgi:hypothetical protein
MGSVVLCDVTPYSPVEVTELLGAHRVSIFKVKLQRDGALTATPWLDACVSPGTSSAYPFE